MQEGNLHNWFSKSKSKDGKPGWVQSDGSPCANEPGETKSPKCYSSRRLAGLKKTKEGKKKIRSADARKSRQDPGQQQKSGASKPTMVRTFKDPKDYKKHPTGDHTPTKEEFEVQKETVIEAKDKKGKGSGTKDDCYHKVKARYDVWPSAYASGALVKCRKKGAANWGNSPKNEEFLALPEMTDIQINAMRKAGIEVEVVDEACWKGYEKKGMKTMFGKKYPNCVKKEETEVTKEGVLDAALKTDKKMGELHKKVDNDVKRMKAGKKFKEEVTEVEEGINLFKKPTPEQKAAKELKKRESLYKQYVRLKKQASDPHSDVNTSKQLVKKEEVELQEAGRIPAQTGNMFQVLFGWRGRMMMIKLFFPDTRYPSRQEVAQALNKIYPDSQLRSYSQSVVDYDDPYINVGVDEEVVKEESPAWQRKEGKSESGGLNQKGVESYRRANPGSKLKTAVTTKPSKLKKGSKSANRRKSFCARMSGMKKRLTSAKTANDPDSRINKSLRKWNC